jgi:NAD(P)H-dependent flavin oxidoreductase YrpB (nitropropane dioxygenase family)
LCGG